MSAILLLAKSFVRQNRWLLLVFVLWPFVLGAFIWSPHRTTAPTDVSEIVQQETLYGLVIVMFLATSAIHNERRSRRIVGVLSKGITRIHYLLGFLAGTTWFAVVYFLMIGTSVLWLLGRSGPVESMLTLCLEGIVASIWIVSLGLLISTLAHPFIAATLTGAAAFAPLAFTAPHPILAPATALIRNADSFAINLNPKAICIGLTESAIFLLVGAEIFSRNDVTASLE